MSTRTSPWPAGMPCWVDLTVPDLDAARRFYEGGPRLVLRRTASEEYGGYVIGPGRRPGGGRHRPAARARHVAGVDGCTSPATTPTRPPRRWASTAARSSLEPGDVGPLGRMLIAADPTGAVFGVWQAGEHIGAGGRQRTRRSHVGGPALARTRRRRRRSTPRCSGTASRPMAEGGPDSGCSTSRRRQPLGGMGGIMGAPDGSPAHWAVYFGVARHGRRSRRRRGRRRAHAHGSAFDTPYGRMAGGQRPVGAPCSGSRRTDGSNIARPLRLRFLHLDRSPGQPMQVQERVRSGGGGRRRGRGSPRGRRGRRWRAPCGPARRVGAGDRRALEEGLHGDARRDVGEARRRQRGRAADDEVGGAERGVLADEDLAGVDQRVDDRVDGVVGHGHLEVLGGVAVGDLDGLVERRRRARSRR